MNAAVYARVSTVDQQPNSAYLLRSQTATPTVDVETNRRGRARHAKELMTVARHELTNARLLVAHEVADLFRTTPKGI
jgi:hypothetical protein